MIYRIWFKEQDEMIAGWFNDDFSRINNYIYDRGGRKKDALKFTINEAIEEAKEIEGKGYHCKIIPEPTLQQYKDFIFR